MLETADILARADVIKAIDDLIRYAADGANVKPFHVDRIAMVVWSRLKGGEPIKPAIELVDAIRAAASSERYWHERYATDFDEVLVALGHEEVCHNHKHAALEAVGRLRNRQPLIDYASELEATVAGGGRFFAPREAAAFAQALREVTGTKPLAPEPGSV